MHFDNVGAADIRNDIVKTLQRASRHSIVNVRVESDIATPFVLVIVIPKCG